ncbi:MAG: hypothetical protein WCP65_00470 [Bacteroidota bacterium]|jgi:hypothetical protein
MRRWFYYIIPIVVFTLSACHRKPVQKPLVFNEPEKPVEVVDEQPPVPFTRDLYNKLRASNIDFRKVQFYVDQQLVLTRSLDKNTLTVEQGIIKYANGKNTNEILIPQLTPCKVDSIDADGFRMKFDNSSNTLKFINNKYSPDFFIFSGANWKDGSCDVVYNKQTYRVSCGTCASASDAKLLVRQSDLDNSQRNTITLPGIKVN